MTLSIKTKVQTLECKKKVNYDVTLMYKHVEIGILDTNWLILQKNWQQRVISKFIQFWHNKNIKRHLNVKNEQQLVIEPLK